jgi:hypothetical protein
MAHLRSSQGQIAGPLTEGTAAVLPSWHKAGSRAGLAKKHSGVLDADNTPASGRSSAGGAARKRGARCSPSRASGRQWSSSLAITARIPR